MIDYILDLLEAVEEVGMGTAALSFSQEEESYPGRQERWEEQADVALSEAPAKIALEEENVIGTKVDRQEPWARHEETPERAEEVLEKKLGAIWRLALDRPQRGLGVASAQAVERSGLGQGTSLLDRLQRGSRMADFGGGGRVVVASPQVVQPGEGEAQASYADFADFDRAVERDARCYDNGFSLF